MVRGALLVTVAAAVLVVLSPLHVSAVFTNSRQRASAILPHLIPAGEPSPLSGAAGDVILKPNMISAQSVGIVLIQGAYIAAEAYIPLASALQVALAATYGVAAWVAIPDFPKSLPDIVFLSEAIHRVELAMNAQGLPKTSPVYIAGHSLGGALIPVYVAKHPDQFRGQMLLGAFLLRPYLNGTENMTTPTITVGGELDGLTRVTRIVESYYHQILVPKGGFVNNATFNYPVTVVAGMSHMQFASGVPPANVVRYDLKPDISNDTAHALAAADMAAFVVAHLPACPPALQSLAVATLAARINQTGALLAPLVAGFELEGSYHMKPPCYDGPHTPDCQISSPWAPIAQELMGGVERAGLSYNVSDEFHMVADTHPVHLPHVLNNCTDPAVPCVLQCKTVTENKYDPLDPFDTAIAPVSAYELRVKLKSRQTVYEHLGMPAVFNVTDEPSICAQINQHAFDWAMNTAAASSLARYQRVGEQYIFGEDLGPYNAGPLWIDTPISYRTVKNNATGLSAMEIRSPMMKTPSKFFIGAAAGMHYCKLISPYRALEWIYVDGIRLYGGINATLPVL